VSVQESFYFGAGPAALPKEVLNVIQNELINYRGTGISVLELSHRSETFTDLVDEAEVLLRELLSIPNEYAVLLQHGGATTQYSMLPINFLNKQAKADYVCSGHWSTKACEEAKKFSQINEIQVLKTKEPVSIIPVEKWQLNDEAVYLHYCENETISGVAFNASLGLKDKSIFCDMTSSILTKPILVKDFDLIYASAQKNLGIAGLCVTIIKKTLLGKVNDNVPSVYDLKKMYQEKSLVNTPPTFAIYVLGLMVKWIKSQGGLESLHENRKVNANLIYELIDSSASYQNEVSVECRSLVNIPFSIKSEEATSKFLHEAEEQGLLGLRGHKSVGGIRISLYNAMPVQGMNKLIEFLHAFSD